MHSLDNSNVFQLEKRDPDGSCSVVRVKNVALDLKGVAYSTTQSQGGSLLSLSARSRPPCQVSTALSIALSLGALFALAPSPPLHPHFHTSNLTSHTICTPFVHPNVLNGCFLQSPVPSTVLLALPTLLALFFTFVVCRSAGLLSAPPYN